MKCGFGFKDLVHSFGNFITSNNISKKLKHKFMKIKFQNLLSSNKDFFLFVKKYKTNFRYSPMNSSDVERSFSILNYILNNNKKYYL